MRTGLLALAFLFFFSFAGAQSRDQGAHRPTEPRLISYVDPFIGTGGHGHTYPGATVPFGMVQLSPDNGTEGWDWCSGYHYSDRTIAGFSHTHLSGTGNSDWCDISVMPSVGLIPDTGRFYKVRFSHAHEQASPGYYAVMLDNGIQAELSATERCGLHRYHFPAGAPPVIRFDLGFHISDSTERCFIRRLNDSTLIGYRVSTGWAHHQQVYFAARCSVSFSRIQWDSSASMGNSKKDRLPALIDSISGGKSSPLQTLTDSMDGNKSSHSLAFPDSMDDDNNGNLLTLTDSIAAGQLKASLVFNGERVGTEGSGSTILLKCALSMTSMDKALLALSEIKDWDFEGTRRKAEDQWEHQLEKIRVQTPDPRLRRIFYTSLYHSCMSPLLYSDADGWYRNARGELHRMPKGQRYTVFSLWDTFRALHPLFTVLQTERLPDVLNSMLAFHDENGLLPAWDLSTNETGSMTGYHSIPVLADAILKNTPGLDAERAYRYMKGSAHQSIRGTPDYIHYGYLPQDKGGSSVTVSLEYGFDDWCIAQVAAKLGRMNEYREYSRRSEAYKLLFDSTTGFIRAKNSDGSRIGSFDPFFVGYGRDVHYREGNAWQYSFFVPQDVHGLAALYGSDEAFLKKLDALFAASSLTTGPDEDSDVSGMLGQYAHGNEPSHHIAYLYNYMGVPWKTQEKVRLIIDSLYHDGIDGYAGNEDCGQMSAWAIWSILGLYPVNPANGRYVFGSPMLDQATLSLPGNKRLIIRARNNGKDHPYIQELRINGRLYTRSWVSHADLMKGGTWEFVMGATPGKTWGVARQDRP